MKMSLVLILLDFVACKLIDIIFVYVFRYSYLLSLLLKHGGGHGATICNVALSTATTIACECAVVVV